MLTVLKSVAQPWQCDVLGHMTTRFFVAMFDDASYHLFNQVFDWPGNNDVDRTVGWVDVRHVIEYKAEVGAGDPLEIRASIAKLGGRSMTVRYEMLNLGRGEIAATLEAVNVLFDLKGRGAVKIGDEMREQAEAHLAPAGH